jgi:cytochrome c biogenesis protein CcmG/thiol:disulfide interchange protein DsbE
VRRWLAVLPLLALAALVALMAVFALNRDPRVKPDALVGRPVPAEMLPTLTGGQAVSLRAAVEGPTVVNVFASWCAPCEVEHPLLVRMQRSGVRVVGLAYKDDPAKTAAFLARLGDPFAQVLSDRDGRMGSNWASRGCRRPSLWDPTG